MDIKTKCNIGDVVYYIENNKIVRGEVFGIRTSFEKYGWDMETAGLIRITYCFQSTVSASTQFHPEDRVYKTIDDLIIDAKTSLRAEV